MNTLFEADWAVVVEGSDKELDPFWIELSKQSEIDGNHNNHPLIINKFNLICWSLIGSKIRKWGVSLHQVKRARIDKNCQNLIFFNQSMNPVTAWLLPCGISWTYYVDRLNVGRRIKGKARSHCHQLPHFMFGFSYWAPMITSQLYVTIHLLPLSLHNLIWELFCMLRFWPRMW